MVELHSSQEVVSKLEYADNVDRLGDDAQTVHHTLGDCRIRIGCALYLQIAEYFKTGSDLCFHSPFVADS